MAIVVALNNKRQSRAGLSGVISYVANDRKTLLQSGEKLVSGINCSPHSAYDEFILTKHLHSKTNGRYFYHYCQSFSPEEKITPETVHEIGVRLAKECFDGYEVIVGTHIEKNHLHNHIIVNSVSFESGTKLHQDKKSLENIRTVSDKICSEYGLSVIKRKDQKTSETMTHGEYTAATLGNSWKFRLINTIEAAMNICKNKAEFISYMESEGYKVNWTDERKSICYTTPGGKKCRDYRLHEDKFLKENMENEFNFRGIKKYEPTDAGLNTNFKSPGYFGGENRQSVTSEQRQTDGGIEFAFNTGWENSRRNFYKNRERVKENPHSGVSHNSVVSDFNNLNYGIGKRVFGLVKSVSGISKKKCYDEDDTAAISLITGLSAASVCILIELIKNTRDEDLTEDYIEEMVDKLVENEENEFGGMNMQ